MKHLEKTKGVDVSAWQGDIDFSKVKASGIDFVIIKAGGSDEGFYKDRFFDLNYTNAKKSGLLVGCYYIVGANFNTPDHGTINATEFEKIIKGKTFDYPAFLDLEIPPPYDNQNVTTASLNFCKYIKKCGFECGIYASSIGGFKDRLDNKRLNAINKWVAQYSQSKPTFPDSFMLWQYTDKGKINGISGCVDLNYSYVDIKTNNEEKKLKNENIKEVQKWVNTNYNFNLAIDGIYGVCTKSALIKSLQAELNAQFNSNLIIDGIFGINTKKAIKNIYFGSRGNITKILQAFLICHGYSTGGFDGIFGTQTLSAVVEYQESINLFPDGIAGKETFFYLSN